MKLDEKHDQLSNAKKKDFCSRYNISDLFLSDCDYDEFFEPRLEDDQKISLMQSLEGYEEKVYVSTTEKKAIEVKELKFLTPNKLSIRLPVLLAQINAGND